MFFLDLIQEREKYILDRAAELIAHHGYDKTTLDDIAAAAGMSRGILYLHFENKEKLFEALVYRETLLYTCIWLECQEANPNGGTIAAMYRNALFADPTRLWNGASLPILYPYSRHVLPVPLDYPAHAHVTGYWFLDQVGD